MAGEIKLIIEMDGQQNVVTVTKKTGAAINDMAEKTKKADTRLDGLKSTLKTVVNGFRFAGESAKFLAGQMGLTRKAISGFASGFKNILGTMRDMNQAIELIKKGFRALGAALQFVKAGAILRQQELALDSLAKKYGTTADVIVKETKRASGGILKTSDAISQASRALTLGLKPDDVVKFSKIARAASKSMGQDFNQMFESITVGVARQSKLWLDNLGIIISVDDANKRYAESVGKLAKDLTDLERRQAFTNEAIRQGNIIVEDMAGVMSDAAQQVAELEAAGGDLWDAFKALAAISAEGGEGITQATGAISTFTEEINELSAAQEKHNLIIALSKKGTAELIPLIAANREKYEALAIELDNVSKPERILKSLLVQRGLGGAIEDTANKLNTLLPLMDEMGINAENSSLSWGKLAARTIIGKDALVKATTWINKAKAAAAPGMNFVMRIKTFFADGFVGPLLRLLGISSEGGEGAPGTGTGTGGAAKEIIDPLVQAQKTIDKLTDSFKKLGKTRLENATEQLAKLRSEFPELSFEIDLAGERIEEFIKKADEIKRLKGIEKIVTDTIAEFVASSRTEINILDKKIETIQQLVNIRRAEADLFADPDPFIQRGEAAIAITLQQIRLEEKKIELAEIEQDIAGQTILRDMDAITILENTITLRKTELEIQRQIADEAERAMEAKIAERFGQMREDPGSLLGGGTVADTDLEALQLSEDAKFEILNAAFVREFELRQAHAAQIAELNKTMVDEARRSAEALVAGGFEVIGTELGNMIAGVEQEKGAFGKAMQGLVGEAAAQFGKFLIVQGVGSIASGLFPPNPQALAAGAAQVAAGTALIALGKAAAASTAAKPSQTGAGASAGAGAAPGGGFAPAPPALQPEQPGGGFVINVNVGGHLVDHAKFVEEILPEFADSIGRGNLGSADINLTGTIE